jgi:hypothetical protein
MTLAFQINTLHPTYVSTQDIVLLTRHKISSLSVDEFAASRLVLLCVHVKFSQMS